MNFTHGSLFSGIGGFDLAAEWMGWENKFHCEWNEFGQKLLKYYWPKSISYGDITKTDFTIWRNRIDILTGGFPCQPYSTAGKRLGKEDDRHLWPEMLRAIREIQPRYVVGENVYGLVNWNGGLVFDEVQTDLEAEGYEVQPVILPACAVGAPHRRERIWFVAYSDKCAKRPPGTSGKAESNGSKNNDEQSRRREPAEQHIGCSDVQRNDTDTENFGLQFPGEARERRSGFKNCNIGNDVANTGRSKWKNRIYGKEPGGKTAEFGDSYTKLGSWAKFPIAEPTICSRNDGISTRLDFDSVWGNTNPRKPYITFAKWRNESIKAYGNAIVPQVAYEIFKAIEMTTT